MIGKITSFKRFVASSPPVQLTLIAGVSGLIYGLAFALPFPLARLYATIPPVDYAQLTQRSPGGFVVYVVSIGALFCLYLWAVRLAVLAGRREAEKRAGLGSLVLLGGGLLATISIFSYPLTAIDLFIYAIRTRGWALYGLNPIATSPGMLPAADPWLGLAGSEWIGAASPYGPAWEGLSLGTFYLGGGDFLRHLFALKFLAALAYVGCAWLVYRILRQYSPRWAVVGTVAFAWNPLVLMESAQNGHNDIVMAFFLLLAVWAFSSGQRTPRRVSGGAARLLTCLFLALSILVKFLTVVTVPFFLLGMVSAQRSWLRRLASMLLYGAIIAVLVASVMLPFWPGWENWAVSQGSMSAGRSLLALLVFGFKGLLGIRQAMRLFLNALLVFFALVCLYYLVRFLIGIGRSGAPSAAGGAGRSLVALPVPLERFPILASFFILFWYVLLVVPIFHAWYLLWFLPLAFLLLPYRRPFVAAIVFSMSALLVIPYFETVRVWCPILLEQPFIGHLIGVSFLIVPPVAALVWSKGKLDALPCVAKPDRVSKRILE